MSSTYRLLCLSHDPALALPTPEWSSGTGGIAATAAVFAARNLSGHEQCDMLIGRYSSPLVEVGCPASFTPGSGTGHRPNGVQCAHRDPQWIDTKWLRLAVLALDVPTDYPARQAVSQLDRCWTTRRLRRLRPLLIPEEADR